MFLVLEENNENLDTLVILVTSYVLFITPGLGGGGTLPPMTLHVNQDWALCFSRK